MTNQQRRAFLRKSGLALTAATLAEPMSLLPVGAQGTQRETGGTKSSLPADMTPRLAQRIAASRFEDLPANVVHEAKRMLLNWVGCAIGGANHETVTLALDALAPFVGAGQASVLGRRERVDALQAALFNGISSHVLDFDDTHAHTAIHPAAPVIPALLALAEYRPFSGRDFVNALVTGVETECRIGNAVTPSHNETGWHITGTAGVFGAAAACARLLGLDAQQIGWALALAATQPVGLEEMFGSMTKSFHPGRAAQNGLTAALLAARGFTSSDHPLEAKRGWLTVMCAKPDPAALFADGFEILKNSYKPFACGLVVHPVIDGCLTLREAHHPAPDAIERVDVRVNPRVMLVTGIAEPKSGLEGKFSVNHAAAVALVEGAAGERQFSDAAVRRPETAALRSRVVATVDPTVDKDQARVTIALKSGEAFSVFVQHAVGSIDKPMSDAAIAAKFRDLAEGVLKPASLQQVVDVCWGADTLADAGEVARRAAVG